MNGLPQIGVRVTQRKGYKRCDVYLGRELIASARVHGHPRYPKIRLTRMPGYKAPNTSPLWKRTQVDRAIRQKLIEGTR